jgi:hypothetical protein
MLLFLHGAYQTASSLLPLIRTTLDLGEEYSDRFLLDNFTIAIPGYKSTDTSFDTKYLQDLINQFYNTKKEIQTEITTKQIFAKNNPALLVLREQKLSIIGYATGGALALVYSSQNAQYCESIILLDVGIRFNSFANWIQKKKSYKMLDTELSQIQRQFDETDNILDKQFLSLLMESTTRKGLKSYLDFTYQFDFSKIYHNLTISQQHDFAKLSIINLLPKKDAFTSHRNLQALQNLIHPKNTLIYTKHTVINVSEEKEANFEYKYLENTQGKLFDFSNVTIVSNALKEFFKL